jgi:hypothetical protein
MQRDEAINILQYGTVNKDNFGRAFTKKIRKKYVDIKMHGIIRKLKNCINL